jgi:hypothetical protein
MKIPLNGRVFELTWNNDQCAVFQPHLIIAIPEYWRRQEDQYCATKEEVSEIVLAPASCENRRFSAPTWRSLWKYMMDELTVSSMNSGNSFRSSRKAVISSANCEI